MSIPSTVSSSNVTRTAELFADIRRLLAPYAEKRKSDFAIVLNLVNKLASETTATAQATGSSSSAPPLIPSSTSTSNAAASQAVRILLQFLMSSRMAMRVASSRQGRIYQFV